MKPFHTSLVVAALFACGVLSGAFRPAAHADEPGEKPFQPVAKALEYKDGDATLEGWVVHDGAVAGKRPVVLVVHEWWGLTDHPKKQAEGFAKKGWLAFAIDVYGKGKVTKDPKQAGQWAAEWRGPEHRDALVKRLKAAMDAISKHESADVSRMAAVGYCFGGTVALEGAWAGLPWKAAVSFHGHPTAPTPEQYAGIKASILVCHGAEDSFVPAEMLAKFQQAMRDAKADWQLAVYAGAVHAFTNPDADAAGIDGVKYHEKAAKRSWKNAVAFLKDAFGE